MTRNYKQLGELAQAILALKKKLEIMTKVEADHKNLYEKATQAQDWHRAMAGNLLVQHKVSASKVASLKAEIERLESQLFELTQDA